MRTLEISEPVDNPGGRPITQDDFEKYYESRQTPTHVVRRKLPRGTRVCYTSPTWINNVKNAIFGTAASCGYNCA